MKRSPLPPRRTPLRSTSQLSRSRLKPVSDKRRRENTKRREILHATYGQYPRCQLCDPLRAHGIVTGCDGWATDGDELLRRSAGGSITDPTNVRPVGRLCHIWIGAHPKAAREWGLVASRYEGGAA